MIYLNNLKFNDLFDEVNNMFKGLSKHSLVTDLIENDNSYEFQIEIPGAKKEDIKIEYKDMNLCVSCELSDSEDSKNYLICERSYKVRQRNYYLDNIKEDSIKARYEDGILYINIDKKDKDSDKKIITIE